MFDTAATDKIGTYCLANNLKRKQVDDKCRTSRILTLDKLETANELLPRVASTISGNISVERVENTFWWHKAVNICSYGPCFHGVN